MRKETKKQLLLIVLMLLIAGGFLLLYKPRNWTASPVEMSRATFQCADGSTFTALFMNNDHINVVRNGAVVSVAAKEAVNRAQYDDVTYSYIFEQQAATVADKNARTLVSCTQITM